MIIKASSSNEQVPQLQQMIDGSRYLVFFGGAGVSTESGIPDFRSADGLYRQKQRYSPEEILSHNFYKTHPSEFFDFYRSNVLHPEAKPGAAHMALAKLEQAGKLKAVITQNIDGLHQTAGSKTVIELHGSAHRNYCEQCGAIYPANFIAETSQPPICQCGGPVRPDVVLYGESLNTAAMLAAAQHIQQADMLIVGGTSLAVYPAAGLLSHYTGTHLVLINKEPTPKDLEATLVLRAPIGEVLNQLVIR